MLFAAIILVTRGLGTKPRLDFSLVPLMVISSIAIIAIIMVISGFSMSDFYRSDVVDVGIVLNFLYPVLDVIALCLVGRLLEVSQQRKVFEAQVMLAIAILIMSFADIYFNIAWTMGVYEIGSLTDQMYIIAYVIFGLSIWRYVNLTRRDIVNNISARKVSSKIENV